MKKLFSNRMAGYSFIKVKLTFETQNISEMLLGNGLILIDRFDGELRVFGTGHTIENYLLKYEKTIPESIMKMSPEFPPDKV